MRIPIRRAISITFRITRAKRKCAYALSNSFGFGGTNASLLFKRWES